MYEYNELLKENLQKKSSGGDSQMTVDDALSETSTNPVQNKVITAALNNQKITVDAALSETSTNPVQNKVITEALNNQKITVDAALSETSTNPVQNKVITEALKPLNTPKITKFFSADATLEDGEIAEYQGENEDTVNNLIPGYFYKKNPDITINKTSSQESLVMRNWFGYDFQNNLIVSHKYTADRTLHEKIFISGNFDNSNDYNVGLFLIAANTTNIFGSKWSLLSDNRRLAPFVFFVENNSVVARYANVVYDGVNFTIDGQRFYYKNQGVGCLAQISYNPDNNCFYYWCFCVLGSIPFNFPVALASSDYSTANLIFTNSLPLIASRLKLVWPAALITYYTYTASINTVLFQQTDTQPRSAIMIVSANYITNNLSDILTQYTNIVQDTVFVLTDIDSAKTYNYTFNSQTKTFKGNNEYDLLFRYCGNNEFKPISFSPIY